MATWWRRLLQTGLLWGSPAMRRKADANVLLRHPLVDLALDRMDQTLHDDDPSGFRVARRVVAPRLRAAERLLAEAVALAPEDWVYRTEAIRKRALCLYYLGRFDDVLDLFEVQAGEDAGFRGTEFAALSLYRLGKDEEALDWATRAIEAGFGDHAPQLYRLRAHLLRARGEEAMADEDLSHDRWAGGAAAMGDLGRMIGCGLLLAAPFALVTWFWSGRDARVGRVFAGLALVFVALYGVGVVTRAVEARRLRNRLAASPRLADLLPEADG